MDIFVAYMILASLTPIILWKTYKKILCICQIPFVILMWHSFMLYSNGANYSLLLLYANIVYSHIAIVIILLQTFSNNTNTFIRVK
ncbi:spore gernimation protein [Bacillus sp. HMF5848]|uniref:spore morphogenesis/germination protein YwcE n=1 Tax=Bacillus sp. HMF5848 TaxID=2495421 RepID=UPI000F7901FE|nr:spore morphogenesis/germination protein YwcE [Bacillus sp. HMF5848]RSK28086.1 spore gernimation protein [Bacillus sp. HMF5848]